MKKRYIAITVLLCLTALLCGLTVNSAQLPYMQTKTAPAFAGTADIRYFSVILITAAAAALPFISGQDGNGKA